MMARFMARHEVCSDGSSTRALLAIGVPRHTTPTYFINMGGGLAAHFMSDVDGRRDHLTNTEAARVKQSFNSVLRPNLMAIGRRRSGIKRAA